MFICTKPYSVKFGNSSNFDFFHILRLFVRNRYMFEIDMISEATENICFSINKNLTTILPFEMYLFIYLYGSTITGCMNFLNVC